MQALCTEQATEALRQLADIATIVLNEHSNDHDRCAVCGCAWPCERVVLAEHNFEVV